MTVSLDALSVVARVAEPERAAGFLVSSLGFELRASSGRGLRLENGALVLTLVEGVGATPLVLEVVTEDLDVAVVALSSTAGVAPLGPAVSVAVDRIERRLATPFGIEVLLSRRLTEDDLGILPPLPKELVWCDAPESTLKELLRHVPLAFREGARLSATRGAEALALADGRVEVTLQDAADGLLCATPSFRRAAVLALLVERGLATSEGAAA